MLLLSLFKRLGQEFVSLDEGGDSSKRTLHFKSWVREVSASLPVVRLCFATGRPILFRTVGKLEHIMMICISLGCRPSQYILNYSLR